MVKAGFLEVTIDTRGMAGRFDTDRDSLAFFVLVEWEVKTHTHQLGGS